MADLGPTSPVPDLSGKSREEIVHAMVMWFFANFEDPAESTPFESAEGGYQYIWGGPHDANEELQEAFLPAVDDPRFAELEALVELAVKEIEEEGWEWAPHSGRLVDDADDHMEESDEQEEG